LRGSALRVSTVLLNEVSLKGCGDLVGRLERVVNSQVPCGVVNHTVSIAATGGSRSEPSGELIEAVRLSPNRGLRLLAETGWRNPAADGLGADV
jgi:hypothetical protein